MRTPIRKTPPAPADDAPLLSSLAGEGMRKTRIPHQKILRALEGNPDGSTSLVEIYRRQVLPVRTRTIRLPGRKSPARILTTLLGYEVLASRKRIQCPDMVTARYLKLFAELGCRTIKLPYDPTATARLLPELEGCIEKIVSGIEALFPENKPVQRYVLRNMYGILRSRLRME